METTIETAEPTILSIEGLHCGGCGRTIERALRQVHGVRTVEVDVGQKMVVVEGSASVRDLVAAVDAAGYEARSVDKVAATVDGNTATKCCCG